MKESGSRAARALERDFGVRFAGRVALGTWGYADSAVFLNDRTLLVVETEVAHERPCTNVVKLWPFVEENPGLRVILVRVSEAGVRSDRTTQARLASFVASRLCDELPESFDCLRLEIDERGTLRGETEHLRRLITESGGTRYFTLSMESLRAIGGWAALCAEKVLPLYETVAQGDSRPRAAIESIKEFASGGKRTARLRTLAVAANAAARDATDPAASAAARAAGAAAASAYTHPLADVDQTKHIVGSAAYAALALELHGDGDRRIAESSVRWAIEQAPSEAGEVLLEMPARQPGKSRLATILYQLDSGIRDRTRGSLGGAEETR